MCVVDPAGVKQAGEIVRVLIHARQRHPSAAQADADFGALMARLKSCPFKAKAEKRVESSFFAVWG